MCQVHVFHMAGACGLDGRCMCSTSQVHALLALSPVNVHPQCATQCLVSEFDGLRKEDTPCGHLAVEASSW